VRWIAFTGYSRIPLDSNTGSALDFFQSQEVRWHVVSLLSLDSTEYTIGDEFSYTLEVRTAGSETVKVPTVFNVADLEPDDPNVSFGYAATEVWLGISESNERYFHVPLLRLYG